MPKYELSPKLRAILERSKVAETAGNYDEALDGDISSFRAGFARAVDREKAEGDYTYNVGMEVIPNIAKFLPTGLSNCTLTATQWVNPALPLMRALTIIDNGRKYGYVEIPEAHVMPGDLAIATNPSNNTHHTMLISGFTDSPSKYTFNNKDYILPADHPLVRYSNGSTHSSGYRRGVGLMEYLDNSDGKTLVQYYRHFDPDAREVLLPEIVVTPKGSYVPKGLKTIRVHLEGGLLSKEAKLDYLNHLYSMRELDREDPQPIITWVDLSSPDEAVDEDFNYYRGLELKGDLIYTTVPPNAIEVIGYFPLKLQTWYPMGHAWHDTRKDKNFKWTGHSAITGGAFGTKTWDDYDYNLVTNNCSDETRRMLEKVFDKESGVVGFTTPGDVRDFALENGGIKKDRQGRTIIIPMNQERYDRLKPYILERRRAKLEYRRAHPKKKK